MNGDQGGVVVSNVFCIVLVPKGRGLVYYKQSTGRLCASMGYCCSWYLFQFLGVNSMRKLLTHH